MNDSATVARNSGLKVINLMVTKEGKIEHKMPNVSPQAQMNNTLLEALCPGIRVASVTVTPEPLDSVERARVESALSRFQIDGDEYRLIGASGSAKNGKYYAVDARFERPLAARFSDWPQAAVTYFGILVSPCMVRMQIPSGRVTVVPDHELGTNDCRGWLRKSIFDRLGMPEGRFYQFRLAFAQTQAKGSFKVMPDDVADALDTDVILPVSSVKPEYKGPSKLLAWLTGEARTFAGEMILGIRECSRQLSFESSYTVVQHAPEDSFELEIKPHALAEAAKLKALLEDRDFTGLFELLGISETQRPLVDEMPAEDEQATSVERSVLEGVLKADPSGYLVQHPWVNTQLERILARWAFKVCTAGGFEMPAFALADDGYLLVHDGTVHSGSDWIPQDRSINALATERGLVVRYPVRMKEDLLPYMKIASAELRQLLAADLANRGCPATDALVSRVASEQIELEGTFTLHSKTAAKNGGDYDFDYVCVVEGDRFPRFVDHRFRYNGNGAVEKTKARKARSPWWNLPQVAVGAMGNQIGSITDLMTQCTAAGREDLHRDLVEQLQLALDQLKHGVTPDQDKIRAIREQIKQTPAAQWLRAKRVRSLRDLPERFECPPTDRIGGMYNLVRKELTDFFSNRLPVGQFRGLVQGYEFTHEMVDECRRLNRAWALTLLAGIEKKKLLQDDVQKAEAAFEEGKEDKDRRSKLLHTLCQARAAMSAYDQRWQEEIRSLIWLVRTWAARKEDNRMGWLQALHTVVCNTKSDQSSGALPFYAFPNELLKAIVERTGGRPVQLAAPKICDGVVEIDEEGSVFLVEEVEGDNGHYKRMTFLMSVTSDGKVVYDGGRERWVHPFPCVAGTGEVRGGKVELPARQLPQVAKPSTSSKE
ncbi:MAG: hypothetical protein IPJ98_00535 [Bryobacterales bacterium]|nr:hypothetical protein [Bryobacterales bacterium]